MVSAVLVALLVPSVSRQASFLGWVAASGAAVAISVHVGFSGALVFAATPLISKALWGLLIVIRQQETQRRADRAAAEAERAAREAEEKAAQETKEAEETAKLSDELTFEQQRQIADKRSEERRVGKEWRDGWGWDEIEKKEGGEGEI